LGYFFQVQKYSVTQTILIRAQAPRERGAAGAPLRGPQDSRGPVNLNVQNGNEQLCTKFLL